MPHMLGQVCFDVGADMWRHHHNPTLAALRRVDPVALPVGDTSRDGDDLGAVADVAVSWLESRVHIKG